MKRENSIILEQIVNSKAEELALEKEKRDYTGPVVSMWKEDWHLFSWLNHPLVPTLELQCSISARQDFVRAVWFPHPTLITPDTRTEFILFCNEANLELHSGGRFWCNEEFDFAYEVVLREEIIENCAKEAAGQLFDIPYAHFTDFHAPLIMLANNTWKSDIAVSYIRELRKNGYVDNADYGLW